MKLSDEQYNTLKWVAQYLLPGLGTLYFALATIWGLPLAEQILGTLTAVDAFLGVLLGLSTAQYRLQESQKKIDNLTPPNDRTTQ
jgi:imidazoleglycerol phosphate synthase glutamine amidotransferase subunit HisH